MGKAIPLDERIVSVLTKPCTSVEASEVRGAAERALADAIAQADAADVAALSPLATRAKAGELRAQAADSRFEADRLEASVSALASRISELLDAERQSEANREYTAALAERDALAEEIAAEWPGIVRRITEIVKRINESDQRCVNAGIHESAESVALGLPATFAVQLQRVQRIHELPLAMPGQHTPAWSGTGAGWKYPGLDIVKKAA